MNWNSIKVLSSYVVRQFVAGGGSLRYRPGRDELGRYWEVVGVDRNGNEIPIIIGRTGLPKLFRSADAILTYHKKMLPKATDVIVQLHDDEDNNDQDADEN